MAQLIEVDSTTPLPQTIVMATGDLLWLKLSGGQVVSGSLVLQQLGPFTTALLQPDGSALAPMGAPNAVLFLARKEGTATISVVDGDPFFSPQPVQIDVIVGL